MAVPSEGWLSLRWFLQGAGILTVPLIHQLVRVSDPVIADVVYNYLLVISVAYIMVNYAVLFVFHRRKCYRQVPFKLYLNKCIVEGLVPTQTTAYFMHTNLNPYLCVDKMNN